MARMVPDRLNNDVQHVERRMFALLAGALSDEYTVLHGARWLNRVPHSKRKTPDYEADFIIANESQGLLVLEVKGGLVSSDAATGKWWSRDMFGNRHSIKDPYSQARENCYSLLDLTGAAAACRETQAPSVTPWCSRTGASTSRSRSLHRRS